MEQQEALLQIKHIREMMQNASHKFFFSPWQWIDWAIVVLVAGGLTQWQLSTGSTAHIPLLWIAAFVVGSTLEGIAWILDAQSRGLDPFNPFLLKIWGVMFCIILPPIIYSIVFIQLNLPYQLVGLWLTSMGAAMYALVLLGERRDLLWFGTLMLIVGILTFSILLEYAVLVGTLSFGLGGLTMGLLLLYKEKHQKKEA